MKKYKAILVALIIGITGFVVYDSFFKPWKEAEKRINKYMVEQGVSKDVIDEITKSKAKKATYKGILYKVSYKDDPGYVYEYLYSDNYYALYGNKVWLQIYDVKKDNKLLRSNEELKNIKYPPIGLIKSDRNKNIEEN
ncbi:MAG: DUF3139 domain-containing protein [Terrisporobacter sp.]